MAKKKGTAKKGKAGAVDAAPADAAPSGAAGWKAGDLVTTPEIERATGVTRQGIARWRRAGLKPCGRVGGGGAFTYKVEDVLRYLAMHRVPEPTDMLGKPVADQRRKKSAPGISGAKDSDLDQRRAKARAAPLGEKHPTGGDAAPSIAAGAVRDEEDDEGEMAAAEAERRFRVARAEKMTIEVAVMRRELVDAGEAAGALARCVSAARQYLQTVPQSMAVAVCNALGIPVTKAALVEQALKDQVETVMNFLAQDVIKAPGSAGAEG